MKTTLVAVVCVVAVVLVLAYSTEVPSTGVDRTHVVRACGREVLPEYPLSVREDFAKGMRLDCGIYGPQATRN